MLNEFITENIPSWALKLPQVQQAVAKQRTDDHAARSELADKRAAGVLARREMFQRHETEMKPLVAADQAAQKKLRGTSEKVIAARNRQNIELAKNEREERTFTRELLATVDPRIDAARCALNDRWDRDRPKMSRSESRPTGRYTSLGHVEKRAYNNAPARKILNEEILTARRNFDALKLANPDDIEAAIALVLEPVEVAWTEAREGALVPFGTAG